MYTYLAIAVTGIAFNSAALIFASFVLLNMNKADLLLVTKRIKENPDNDIRFRSRWVYMVPFSTGFLILYALTKNMHWLHNLKKGGE